MIGAFVLALRILLVLALYGFLGWAIWTITQDLKRAGFQTSPHKTRVIRLDVWARDGHVVSRSFSKAEVTLGRDPACDILLDEETVSARHAKLSFHHNQWWLEDLHSTNGTSLNDARLNTATVLANGDEIRCGNTRLIVNLGSESVVPVTQRL